MSGALTIPSEIFSGGVLFCGISGVSMLQLALFTRLGNVKVLGSDRAPTERAIRICKENGIPLFFSHDRENLCDASYVVRSSAVKEDVPELARARELGLCVMSRSEYLAEIAKRFESSIMVAGTHGKSTVSLMTESILKAYGCAPSLFAGAEPTNSEGFSFGGRKVAVIEACEYNRSFLDLTPSISVILNIEKEHTDTYPTVNDAADAFFEFAGRSRICIINNDCKKCRDVSEKLRGSGIRVITFSVNEGEGDCYICNISERKGYFTFDISVFGDVTTEGITLSVPGFHNVSNALAAAAASYAYAVSSHPQSAKCDFSISKAIARGLESYKGARRRLELIGRCGEADVFDDYAHHPTEIRASLSALSSLGYERIICAFQPHTYSRTAALFGEFADSFKLCESVLLADIFAAREENVYGISSEALASAIPNAQYLGSQEKIYSFLRASSHPKTALITMGAGKLCEVSRMLVENEEDPPN
jgi:UDP-N-acetylmuramate--alanine ligase